MGNEEHPYMSVAYYPYLGNMPIIKGYKFAL